MIVLSLKEWEIMKTGLSRGNRRAHALALASIFCLIAINAGAASGAEIRKPGSGTLTLALGALGNQKMDPTSDSASHGKPWWELMYDYLIGSTDDGKLSKESGVASDWTCTNDATDPNCSFTIRKGVKFSNGDDLTSADVAFSIGYHTRPESRSVGAKLLRSVIKRVDTPDPHKLIVHMNRFYILLPHVLSRAADIEGTIVPKRYIESKGSGYFAENPVGSGPYRLVENVLGSHIKLESWGTHFHVGAPKYRNIVFKLVPEEATRIAGLKRGEIDVIDISTSAAKLLSGADLTIYRRRDAQIVEMHLQNTSYKGTFLVDRRVREALNLAIDRAAIVKTIFGGNAKVDASNAEFGSAAIGYKQLSPYQYDPARAKKLVQEAFPGGVTLTVAAYPRPGIPELALVNQSVASMWTNIGVKVEYRPTDMNVILDASKAGKLDNTAMAHNHENRPTLEGVYPVMYASTGLFTYLKDPELDVLIKAMERAVTLEQVGSTQLAVAEYIRKNSLVVPLLTTDLLFAANKKRIPRWDLGRIQYSFNIPDLVKQ